MAKGSSAKEALRLSSLSRLGKGRLEGSRLRRLSIHCLSGGLRACLLLGGGRLHVK